jgi:flagellar hook-length control protein FliK
MRVPPDFRVRRHAGVQRNKDTESDMEIQALSSKANPPAANPGAAGNDDESAAGIFAALLGAVGGRFKGDAGLTMDAKLMRGDDGANERANDAARDAARVREEKNEDRAANKTKESKSRDNNKDDTSEADETKSAANDDSAKDTDTAETAQTAPDQAGAAVTGPALLDIPIANTETLAPVLIAQQAAAPVDTATAQQSVVQTVAAVDDTAAVAKVAAVADATTGTDKSATVDAPAAVQKAVETVGANVKKPTAQHAAPVQSVTADTTAKTAVVSTEAAAASTKETAQITTTTQRSAAAQAQSQDLSRQVDSGTKAQVQVTVTSHASAQTTQVASVYDIYSGYNNTQATTTNGQAAAPADAGATLAQNTKTPAETVQAPVATQASPVLAPPPASQTVQQGASPSAMRADIAAVGPAAVGAGSHTPSGETTFGNAGTNTGSQSSATSSTSQTAPAERPLATSQQVIDQIKVNITRAAKAGLDRVTIQLKPHELGRVDVQLEMSEDHKVRVTVTADNKETLALLQNDSRTLERALNEAGLRTDANNLHFSLRSESEARDGGDGRGTGKNGSANDNGPDDADDLAMTYDYSAAALARGGIDTFA